MFHFDFFNFKTEKMDRFPNCRILAFACCVSCAYSSCITTSTGCNPTGTAACPTLTVSATASTISAAIASCSRSGGGSVTLARGIFHISEAIVGTGIRNVHLRGQGGSGNANAGGTEFLLTAVTNTFSFTNASNIKVSGISVDMQRQPYTYGRAVAVSNDSMTVQFNTTEYPFPSPLPSSSYLSKVQSVTNYDAANGRPSASAVDLYLTSDPVAVTTVAGDTITIPIGTSNSGNIKTGDMYVLRHEVYGRNGYDATRCTNMTVDDVTLFSTPGMKNVFF